jgi:hypothetical protein
LADAYPDRHVLGLGFGDARPGIKPLAAMNEAIGELWLVEGGLRLGHQVGNLFVLLLTAAQVIQLLRHKTKSRTCTAQTLA